MGTEIERKFLVTSEVWKTVTPTYYCQAYLNRDQDRTVRIRIAGESGVLTIKGKTIGATRDEFEYSIPLEDAKQMLSLCHQPVIEKNRYVIPHAGLEWEVDEFLGENQGLVVAEVELESEDQKVILPEWIGQEVTSDSRYFNSRLSETPFSKW